VKGIGMTRDSGRSFDAFVEIDGNGQLADVAGRETCDIELAGEVDEKYPEISSEQPGAEGV
jgi:hypothetical protein